MALTPEQINNLKKGDPIVIHTTFEFVDYDGDVRFLAPYRSEPKHQSYIAPEYVSLPTEHKAVIDARDIFRNMSEDEKAMVDDFLSSYFRETKKQDEMRNALKKMGVDLTNIRPKHDPTRLFKKGDKVEPRERYGRKPDDDAPVNVLCEVAEDEYEDGTVNIIYTHDHITELFQVTALYLELVTPVEEKGPYSVRHNEAHAAWSIYGPYNLSAVNYFYGEHYPYTEESALAAAEAERDSLNAEWRKEHANG